MMQHGAPFWTYDMCSIFPLQLPSEIISAPMNIQQVTLSITTAMQLGLHTLHPKYYFYPCCITLYLVNKFQSNVQISNFIKIYSAVLQLLQLTDGRKDRHGAITRCILAATETCEVPNSVAWCLHLSTCTHIKTPEHLN